MLDKVDIIITSRNRFNDLLFTIREMVTIGFQETQFYIVDDASDNFSKESLTALYPGLHVYQNSTPKGYIFNRNFLMKETSRPYVLSLDDDSHIRSREDVEEAVRLLEQENSYGIFTFNAFEQKESPPAKSLLPASVRELRTYIGCGHIIKREVIDKIGYYKEEFEFYCEELDFSIRAYMYGYKVITQDNLVVHHRIDWNERKTQTRNEHNKGIYGAIWRSKMGFSNNLIVTSLYYPHGIDLMFVGLYSFKRFYHYFLKKKDYQGYVAGLSRYLSFYGFIRKNQSKMKLQLFRNWLLLPTK